jgi:hypothetical protein
MEIDDAIDSVRKKDLDFKVSEKRVNPKDQKRPGRGSLILTQILSPKPIVRGEICSGLHF